MVETAFSTETIHTVTEANFNYYATPFVHPRRNMSEHDFIYVLQGEWKIGQNEEVYSLRKDSLLILSAGQTHFGASACTPGTKTMYFHATCCDGDGLLWTASKQAGQLCVQSFMDASENKDIKMLFSQIVHSKLSGNQRKADLYMELLLCEIAGCPGQPAGTDVAENIRFVIQSNPERFFSNLDLAQMNDVSVKTAETRFKAMFGKTIHQYILEFKIREAISYFTFFPEISIREVASNLGFYDEYHFSKQFKRFTGRSPSAWKKDKNGSVSVMTTD